MKKLCLVVLSFLMIITLPAHVRAQEQTSDSENEVNVITTQMQEINEYAIENFQDILDAHCYFNGTNDNLFAQLGSGFRVDNSNVADASAEYYLFPIFVGDNVKYMYRVYRQDGEFQGILSEILAEEFNNLLPKLNGDVAFVLSNDNILAIESNNCSVLLESPSGKDYHVADVNYAKDMYFSNEKLRNTNDFEKVNVKKILASSSKENINNSPRALVEPRATGILTIDYLEKQTSLPWCAGYVTANILRFMTKDSSIRALDIANYGGISTSQGIPIEVLQGYSRTKGITMSNYVNGEISPSSLYSYLQDRRPIYESMKVVNADGLHALVLHGISGNYYYVRNPWYQSSETYSYGGYYYPSESSITFDPYRYATFSK